jgi:UDP-N-acetylmuramoyl-tripeptide--D-alanyl-D-alanine ligase
MIRYGTGQTCFLKGEIIDRPPFLCLNISDNQSIIHIKTRLIGNYNFENALAAATIGYYFGIEMNPIKEALENYIPSNNRSQWIVAGTNQIIMDAYNANPSSMSASLFHFFQMDSFHKVVILGDMLELGDEALSEHQKIVDILTKQQNLSVFLVGKIFAQTCKPVNFRLFPDTVELMAWLSYHPVANSMILIKGSHGIRLDKVIASFN